MVKRSVAALLIVALLCALFMQPDWQAAGNMTSELPLIRMYIDTAIEAGLTEEETAQNISDSCNAQWDEFWNVAMVELSSASADAVIYGYAFRAHWYWHNNYGSRMQSFVIWKDYNCIDRMSSTKNRGSFSSNELGNAVIVAQRPNIWEWAENAMDNFFHQTAADQLTSGDKTRVAVTGVFVNDIDASIRMRVCVQTINKYAFLSTNNGGVMAVAFVMREDPGPI